MQTLQPGDQFPLVYQVPDPADTTTYYVRAVIKDKNGTVQVGGNSFLNLASEGSGRWSAIWTVPAGESRYVDVTYNIYTDSGYTTASESYEKEVEKYVIRSQQRFGGGGGISLDEVRKIVREEIAKIPKVEFPAFPKIKEVDLSPVLSKIDAIDIPKPEKTDLSPILTQLNALGEAIRAIPTDTTPETDLTHVLEGIQNLAHSIGEINPEAKGDIEGCMDELGKFIETKNTELMKSMEDMHGTLKKPMNVQLPSIMGTANVQEPKEEKPKRMIFGMQEP